MQSGLIYGHMGLVEYMVSKMKKELSDITGKSDVKVIATGGLASMISNGVSCIDEVERDLTLEGLEIIYQKNQKPCSKMSKEYEWNDEDK